MKKLIKKIFINHLKNEIQENRILLGNMLSKQNNLLGPVKDLREVEFKVFSQWGDDGIIQYLIHQIDLPHQTFIEFGVENYTEANTRFLLINDNWSGLIMDGSEKKLSDTKNDSIAWRHDLQIQTAFVTTENINLLIKNSGFERDVGLLHIDIDGNDYYIWKAIDSISPMIVIVEYNSVFGRTEAYSTPYQPNFERNQYHHSNLLYGASLTSLCDLAEEKGYYFVGCNSAGNNAYFVRKDKIGNIAVKTTADGYVESKFRESRNPDGTLSYLRASDRLNSLRGQKVYDTRLKKIVAL